MKPYVGETRWVENVLQQWDGHRWRAVSKIFHYQEGVSELVLLTSTLPKVQS